MLELKILWSIGPKGKDGRMKDFSRVEQQPLGFSAVILL